MAERVRASARTPSANPKELQGPAKTIELDTEQMSTYDKIRSKSAKGDDALIAEFEQHMLVDKDALDEALIQQPDLVYRISKVLIERVSQRDAAKQDHSEAEAIADAKIRRDAAIAEEKITADQVKSEVRVNKDVVKCADRLAELNFRVNQWSIIKDAFQTRSHVLRDLVSLYANNYWADASSGRARSQRRDQEGDTNRDALARARRSGTDK